MRRKLLLLVALLFVLGLSVHAQTMCCFGSWGVPLDMGLSYGQSSPYWGFTVYSTPGFPFYQYFNLSRNWQWISTCPQGGIAVAGITTTGMPPYIDEVDVSAQMLNPLTGFQQAHFAGFAVSLASGQPPVFVTKDNHGGPCAQSSGRYQTGQ